MTGSLGSLVGAFKLPDLRRRILYVFGMFAVYTVGLHIPIPGISRVRVGAPSGHRLVSWCDDSVHQSPLQQPRITAAASSATVSRELGGDPTIPCNPEISTKRIFQSLRTTTDPSPTTKAPWPSPLTGAVLCRVWASSSK